MCAAEDVPSDLATARGLQRQQEQREVSPPTTWTILEQDGPNHLDCDAMRLREHQMALITSDCVPFRAPGSKSGTPPAGLRPRSTAAAAAAAAAKLLCGWSSAAAAAAAASYCAGWRLPRRLCMRGRALLVQHEGRTKVNQAFFVFM